MMDGCYCNNGEKSRSSSSPGSLPQSLLDSYFCTNDHRDYVCFGHKDEDSLETENSEILSSISMRLQQQTHEQKSECQHDENEFDMSAFSSMYEEMDMEHLFLKDSVRQSVPEEFLPSEQWHPSSSSSSQWSLSTASTECSVQTNDHYQNFKFPTLKTEDMIITQAISAIFSSTSTSSDSSALVQSLRQAQTNRSLATCHSGFMPYNSSIPPKSEPRNKSCGQKMIKDFISYLRKINLVRDGAANQESQPTGHQLQHIISERRRRGELNGSFSELRLLLPPSSKKDKASVLCKTKDYLKTLEAQIFELEQMNQMLEKHLLPKDEPKEAVSGSICSRSVQIIEAFEPVIGIRRINLKITVRQCDVLELVLHALEYLKEIRAISLVSIDANTHLKQMVQFTRATIKFDIKESDWDEASFKKGMTRAVDIADMSPSGYLSAQQEII